VTGRLHEAHKIRRRLVRDKDGTADVVAHEPPMVNRLPDGQADNA